jgi:hypothetical protein
MSSNCGGGVFIGGRGKEFDFFWDFLFLIKMVK